MMQALNLNFTPQRRATVVDISICGDILRVVMDGFPPLAAKTPTEALQELRDKHNDFRHFLIGAPRGHPHVNACLLLPAFSDNAVRTLVVAPDFGYTALAGTLLMAATTALIETQQMTITESTTPVIFDTAKGQMEIVATIKKGRCVATRWTTKKPHIIHFNHEVILKDNRRIFISLIDSGLPYIVVHAADLNVNMSDINALGVAGSMLSRIVNQQLSAQGNNLGQDKTPFLVMIIDNFSIGSDGNNPSVTAAWVSLTGAVALSPAGTGALSVAAYFNQLGQLPLGILLTVISPSGCQFTCQLNKNNAYVETKGQLIALSELIQDPLQVK